MYISEMIESHSIYTKLSQYVDDCHRGVVSRSLCDYICDVIYMTDPVWDVATDIHDEMRTNLGSILAEGC